MPKHRKIESRKRKHKIRTISDLARHLGINEVFLKYLATELDRRGEKLYRSWPQPKPSGGYRPIDTPREELKVVQDLINRRILQRIQIHNVAFGGIRGKRLIDNLRPHVGQPMVGTFDLKSFFSNVTNGQVYRMFYNIGMSPDVSRIMTRLTTYKGRLPQGAPTSPMVANLVAGYGGKACLDGRIEGLSRHHNASPGRWIDDITISGPLYLPRLRPTVENIVKQSGFKTNDKTAFASANQSQVVTGHLVNVKPNVKKSERRKLRAALHRCKTRGPEECAECSVDKLKQQLRGKIAHLASINPATGAKFLKEFNAIRWPS